MPVTYSKDQLQRMHKVLVPVSLNSGHVGLLSLPSEADAHGLGGRRSGDESAANCRLIAAAPQLLEALEALYTIYVREGAAVTPAAEIGEAWTRARAALKAARGEA